MQKTSTMRTSRKNIFQGQLTIGWVWPDRSSAYNTPLGTSENRSYKSADGSVATEAAWLNGKREKSAWKAPNTLDRERPSQGRN